MPSRLSKRKQGKKYKSIIQVHYIRRETFECRAQGRKGIACKAGDNNQMMMEQVARGKAAVWEYSEARALALARASEHVSGNSQHVRVYGRC